MNYDYEVRSSKKAFEEMPRIKVEGEMLDLAKHIIGTKKGTFDPAAFGGLPLKRRWPSPSRPSSRDDRFQTEKGRGLQAKRPARRTSPERRSVEGGGGQAQTHGRQQCQCWRGSSARHARIGVKRRGGEIRFPSKG